MLQPTVQSRFNFDTDMLRCDEKKFPPEHLFRLEKILQYIFTYYNIFLPNEKKYHNIYSCQIKGVGLGNGRQL